MADFQAQVALCCTAEELFDFLVHPANLPEIMPTDTPLEVIEAPERLEAGSLLTVDLDGFGPTQRMTYEVTLFDPPHSFSETMVKGPLGVWQHHRTITDGGGMVELIEKITFEPPTGLAGLLLTESRIEASLKSSFPHRHRRLRELLEAS